MRAIIWISFLVTLLFMGCATQPKVAIPSNAKIGIMVLVDANPKHVHVGTTMFNNFERGDVSIWGVEGEWYSYAHDLLARTSSFTVRRIEPTEALLNNRTSLIAASWNSLILDQDMIPEFTRIGKIEDIDFLVVIYPIRKEVERNSAVNTDGYGVYTRCLLGHCRAEALTNVGVAVYTMRPPSLLSLGIASENNYPLSLDLSGEVKELPEREIDKAKQPISEYIKDSITEALERAGLLLSQVSN